MTFLSDYLETTKLKTITLKKSSRFIQINQKATKFAKNDNLFEKTFNNVFRILIIRYQKILCITKTSDSCNIIV